MATSVKSAGTEQTSRGAKLKSEAPKKSAAKKAAPARNEVSTGFGERNDPISRAAARAGTRKASIPKPIDVRPRPIPAPIDVRPLPIPKPIDVRPRPIPSPIDIVKLKPQVANAIQNAAEHLSKADLKGKKVDGLLLGTYVQAGDVSLPRSINPRGEPASVFVCMNGQGGVARPGTKVDGNSARHYYVKVGDSTYGPLEFNNPLYTK